MSLMTYLENDGQKPLTKEEIKAFEEKYQFRFPPELKALYLKQNGGLLDECGISEDDCFLAEVYPLISHDDDHDEILTVKKLLKWQKQDKLIPMEYIPFCADEAGDNYYLNIKNQGIYYISHEFFDEFEEDPENCKIAGSFQEFDEMIIDLEE